MTENPEAFHDPVLFVPGLDGKVPELIDLARKLDNGQFYGTYSGESLQCMRTRYPRLEVGEMATVIADREAGLITAPAETTEDAYTYALEVLPPEDWTRRGGWETFKMCERLSGRITAVYAVNRARKFFAFNDQDSLTHEQIVAKVEAALAAKHI
jgi:hypothetical protein